MKMKSSDIKKAIILAGGEGTRLAQISAGLPKPLFPVCGEAILSRQLKILAREGISEAVIVTGYKSEVIKDYFASSSGFGIDISFYEESEPLGTGGALALLGFAEDILLCSGDLIFDFSLDRMYAFHRQSGALATLFAHPNSHPADSTAIICGKDGRISAFVPKESKTDCCENLSNAGIQILSREFLRNLEPGGAKDLDRDILMPAVNSGRLFAYRCTEYVHDAGTPARLEKAEKDISLGIPAKRNLRNKQRAVFIDRDGTLNVYKGYITNKDDIELLPGAAQALKMINDSGMLAVLATNQAVIARGDCTFEELDAINARLEDLLGREGAYLDAIYYCPHHPEPGHPGERPEYKIKCNCRKPAPGMLLKAAEDLNIDLASSYMAGDALSDRQAGINAGCKSVLLSCGKQESEAEGLADYPDLLSFCKDIFS